MSFINQKFTHTESNLHVQGKTSQKDVVPLLCQGLFKD